MPVHRSGAPRRARSPRTASVMFLALAALLLGPSGTAGAAPAPPPGPAPSSYGKSAPEPTHPDRDWAGSQVAAHEGDPPGQAPKPPVAASVEGVDVSSHNGNVAWQTLWNGGVRFAYVKATESTSYTNPYFTQQYNGSYDVGMIRGAYHFATPNTSSGAAQANYFVDHGGGWSGDGRTLPGALDMEYNPYGSTCYGKSATGLINWIKDWFATYKERTGRDAVIYTSTGWWKQCTGNYADFGSVNPLWIPRYGTSAGELPSGWGFHTIWQYTSSGTTVGDRDRFNGAYDRLQALANG
ncbi:lysozyme [Streptomyces sp. MST-110588]|uniref:lysozyme n=1 Tax=Streptomyces sp. MST-110588 TaxID=2833628 RepID=UPI001F5C14FE|nr:lysozyme [Streptomyces sp. MST-110588]UNO39956.1 lysozyme [Streptomyces sp. MST-110588]